MKLKFDKKNQEKYCDLNKKDNNSQLYNFKNQTNSNKESINAILKILLNSKIKNIILLINRLTLKYYQRII